jgi:hypothetical protein
MEAVMNAKTWYWLALGVVALGLNSEYQHGRMAWLQTAMQRSIGYLECASSQAVRYVTLAEALVCHRRAPAESNPQMLAAMARVQGELAQHRAEYAQRQAEYARRQMELVRPQMRAEMALRASEFSNHARMLAVSAERDTDSFVGTGREISVQVPDVNIPEIQIPEIDGPEVHVSGFTVPAVNVPAVVVPRVVVPKIIVPKIVVPAVNVHVPNPVVRVPNTDDCNDNGPI